MSKNYNDDEKFTVKIVNAQDIPVPNMKVNFNLNGDSYDTITDSNGYASRPVDLNPGEYKITTRCNGISVTNKISITNDIRIISSDMSKYSCDKGDFTVKIVNAQDILVPNMKVNFKLDGKEYNNFSDNKGYAGIPVDLNLGEYKITTTCNGISVTNIILIFEFIKIINLENNFNNTKVCESFT